ncbi:hypothetical protein C6N75_09650 [Streptomyces solincola]|uniref:DUF932 domain-containing protein n=1 Tax=Streptomyces solincola TaxID=2100817 RepID=A0A2S9PY52_9ACTN|nr:DUF932 domain-containing protein [Streptomyces solincola]PRH79339.1 hypothetical protein C6N75_09650 [Streptomyces solincola]
MSRETLDWLSSNTLIGFTEKRGPAWHHRAGDDNHYPGPIPVELVERRLFDWEAEERELFTATHNPGSGESAFRAVLGSKAIVRSDTGSVLGIFKDGYQPHQYREWLLSNVATILDDDLQIGSAGLLRGGAIAWVSVEVAENRSMAGGIVFRPFLMATTSFDGSLATTYKRGVTNVVCDNTMNAFLREAGETFRVRHSAKSLTKLARARDALGIVFDTGDAFEREVEHLLSVKVDDATWGRIVDELMPMPDNLTTRAGKVAAAHATKKRDAVQQLYHHDLRVAPWAGTGWGAWQAFNTWGQHEKQVRGATRQERNMLRTATGDIEKEDVATVERILSLAA